ncbi:MAG TPA: TonB-dependent siderophore receptor [Pseudomonas xinjiangensis]|uniref:TonB-dependent siderophore receptor n=2 Tax=root TaxID=1 RepID=A0A7V1BP86_9GAMM|nr:TonB-dependent siderophore receptor [Halopseudomonas xinjiangensis]HEC47299.1 TonB-dependent siderophore receptor [Halopseudomonas xinjiangensis]
MPATHFKRSVLSLTLASLIPVAAHAQSESDETTLTLPSVVVKASADASAEGLKPAYAGGQVATGGRLGILGNQDNMETPFSLTSYTQTLIQDQQAASVGEVLLNDPAVRVARGFGNFQQVYLVRGLPIFSDDMSYNGLYGLLPRQYVAAELVERVEVLRGANAFLNGAAPGGSGLGGAINVVPKRAPNYPLKQITAGIQSGGQTYAAGDFAQRFADDRFGLRLNLANRDGETAVDGASSELSLISLGADYRHEGLRISADLGHQEHRLDGAQPNITIGPGLDIPSAPDASESVAQPWTYSSARDTFGTLRAEYDFNENITGWIAGGMREGDESGSFSNPTVINASGDTNATRFDNVREDQVKTGDVGVRGSFATGSVGHSLSLSASVFESESRNAFAFSDFGGFANNLYAPTDVTAPPANAFLGGTFDDPLVTEEIETSSVALADVLSFMEDRLQVTVGARHQKIETRSYDATTGEQSADYSESAVTPVAGVLYRITPSISTYANYIEGLVKGDVAPAEAGSRPVINAGEALEPYQTEQTEVGLKYDGGRIGGNLSVYQSRKPIAGTENGEYQVVDHQRNRGLELSVFGQPVQGLSVLGGISLLDAEVDGNEAIGAPTTQANLGVDWMVPGMQGLSLDGRAIYTSSQYADLANTQEVPSWTRFDLGARYTALVNDEQQLTVRARVENVADRDYWASVGGFPGSGYLTVGAPRTLVLSTTLDF